MPTVQESLYLKHHLRLRQTLEIRDAPPPPDDKNMIDTYFHLFYSEDDFIPVSGLKSSFAYPLDRWRSML